MEVASYDTVDGKDRTDLVDGIVTTRDNDHVAVQEYTPLRGGRGFVGHIMNATFEVNDGKGEYSLRLWARERHQVEAAVSKISRISEVSLMEVHV